MQEGVGLSYKLPLPAPQELTHDRAAAEAALRERLGTLRYLKTLGRGPDGGATGEACPICHDALGLQQAMLPCGHRLCPRCSVGLAEHRSAAVSSGVGGGWGLIRRGHCGNSRAGNVLIPTRFGKRCLRLQVPTSAISVLHRAITCPSVYLGGWQPHQKPGLSPPSKLTKHPLCMPQGGKILCPSCRARTQLAEIAYIDTREDVGGKEEAGKKARPIKGSYGTKV